MRFKAQKKVSLCLGHLTITKLLTLYCWTVTRFQCVVSRGALRKRRVVSLVTFFHKHTRAKSVHFYDQQAINFRCKNICLHILALIDYISEMLSKKGKFSKDQKTKSEPKERSYSSQTM